MGIYVNQGNEEFKRAANSKIYVDKTMLLAFTNQNLKSEHQNICVSRPLPLREIHGSQHAVCLLWCGKRFTCIV